MILQPQCDPHSFSEFPSSFISTKVLAASTILGSLPVFLSPVTLTLMVSFILGWGLSVFYFSESPGIFNIMEQVY